MSFKGGWVGIRGFVRGEVGEERRGEVEGGFEVVRGLCVWVLIKTSSTCVRGLELCDEAWVAGCCL